MTKKNITIAFIVALASTLFSLMALLIEKRFNDGSLFFFIATNIVLFVVVFFIARKLFAISRAEKDNQVSKESPSEEEKQKQKMESYAMFSRLNPSPVFKVNAAGIVVEANKAANRAFERDSIVGMFMHEVIKPWKGIDLQDLIKNNKMLEVKSDVHSSEYLFTILGLSELNAIHVYGRKLLSIQGENKGNEGEEAYRVVKIRVN